MVDLKELGEGASLGGVYTLERWIREDGAGTFFAALTPDGERLLIKLVDKQSPDAEQLFGSWQRSRHLRHAHLLDLRDVGRSALGGKNFIYCVLEYPDVVLASALEQGPLSEADARDTLGAVLASLRYLHSQGLVHGAVDADRIVAVGETVKLMTDGLSESDSLEGYAEDVRQLGELVRRLREPEPLSEPLAVIARHATAVEALQRWTLAEIARVLESAPPVAVAAPEPPPAVEPAPPVEAVEAVEPPVTATATPPESPVPARPVPRSEPEAPTRGGFPKWIFAAVAILFAILIVSLRPKPEITQVSLPPVAPVKPMAVKPMAPPAAIAPAPAQGIWRVIAFTYRSRDVAAKKAKQINNRWPDLRAAVFAPKRLGGYYLVALGDGMRREEATRLQRKALSLGLPRDTYVQNYSE